MLPGTRFDTIKGTKMDTQNVILRESSKVERLGMKERVGAVISFLKNNYMSFNCRY